MDHLSRFEAFMALLPLHKRSALEVTRLVIRPVVDVILLPQLTGNAADPQMLIVDHRDLQVLSAYIVSDPFN